MFNQEIRKQREALCKAEANLKVLEKFESLSAPLPVSSSEWMAIMSTCLVYNNSAAEQVAEKIFGGATAKADGNYIECQYKNCVFVLPQFASAKIKVKTIFDDGVDMERRYTFSEFSDYNPKSEMERYFSHFPEMKEYLLYPPRDICDIFKCLLKKHQ